VLCAKLWSRVREAYLLCTELRNSRSCQGQTEIITIKTAWSESASDLYRPSDRRLSEKLVPIFWITEKHFEDWRCPVICVTDPYGRILSFIDRSHYFFFQLAPHLYSRGWADPVPDPLLLRKSGCAGNRIRTSGSVHRISDHWATEVALESLVIIIIIIIIMTITVIEIQNI
jgi:hypothetical protein